eukprot:4057166-Pleurochrysis_carterae.AAC.1
MGTCVVITFLHVDTRLCMLLSKGDGQAERKVVSKVEINVGTPKSIGSHRVWKKLVEAPLRGKLSASSSMVRVMAHTIVYPYTTGVM